MPRHKADECSGRLAKIPGVGPIGAALLMMKTPAAVIFRSGRQFAARIGLTPKDHSTAGKVRLGVIARAGDAALRSVLVVGAAVIARSARSPMRIEARGGPILPRGNPAACIIAQDGVGVIPGLKERLAARFGTLGRL